MMKYLYGMIRALTEGDDPETTFPTRCNGLLITRKRDIYQHVDMAKEARMMPQWGGFNYATLTGDNKEFRQFHGESISCRVKTGYNAQEIIQEIIKEGNVWYAIHPEHKTMVIAFLQTDYIPAPARGTDPLVWVKSNMDEVCTMLKAEYDNAHY